MSEVILYKEDLDKTKCSCGKPACEDPVYIHSACHLEKPPWIEYFDGILTIKCSVCGEEVAKIAVAKKDA